MHGDLILVAHCGCPNRKGNIRVLSICMEIVVIDSKGTRNMIQDGVYEKIAYQSNRNLFF